MAVSAISIRKALCLGNNEAVCNQLSSTGANKEPPVTPLHPLRLCKEINDFLTEDTIFISDGGDIVTMSASVIRTHKPGH